MCFLKTLLLLINLHLPVTCLQPLIFFSQHFMVQYHWSHERQRRKKDKEICTGRYHFLTSEKTECWLNLLKDSKLHNNSFLQIGITFICILKHMFESNIYIVFLIFIFRVPNRTCKNELANEKLKIKLPRTSEKCVSSFFHRYKQ